MGKTTWVRSAFPDALMVDLLDAATYRELAARPERLAAQVAATGATTVVVDEVQRLPELLYTVHSLIESDRALRFVLTGSSIRALRRAGVNLLGGRAGHRELHPFLAAELGSRFRLDDALAHGLVPVVSQARDRRRAASSYASLYVDTEVRAEQWTRNIGGFSRFLEAMSFSHAAELNLSAVAREAGVPRATVSGFLEILEDLLLGFRLRVFSRRAKRRLARRPKFFFFDAGVYRAFRPTGPLDRPTEIEGPALEGLVVQHLRAWAACRDGKERISTWRTRAGVEVDFVIYGPDEFAAIEVKNNRRVRPEDLRGLRRFGEDYPDARRLLLYRGADRLLTDGILCLPVEEFLTALHPSSPLATAAGPPRDQSEGTR